MFVAQSELELRQKQEEDELYATFKREKAKKIEKIERELEIEKERSVKEMIDGFEQLKKHRDQESLETEKRKLEVLYRYGLDDTGCCSTMIMITSSSNTF